MSRWLPVVVWFLSSACGTVLGPCPSIADACSCNARADCVLITDSCWCSSECNPDIRCVCGGGKFVRCDIRK